MEIIKRASGVRFSNEEKENIHEVYNYFETIKKLMGDFPEIEIYDGEETWDIDKETIQDILDNLTVFF